MKKYFGTDGIRGKVNQGLINGEKFFKFGLAAATYFTNPKKNSVDEFLVEKKSPLVMPPEFNELPIPNQNEDTSQKQENNIKNLISDNNGNTDQEVSNSDLEGSILSKIKNK